MVACQEAPGPQMEPLAIHPDCVPLDVSMTTSSWLAVRGTVTVLRSLAQAHRVDLK